MDESIEKFLTASKFKNWIACNYTTINEINKKELKKRIHQKLKKSGDKEEMSLRKKFTKS